MNKQLVDEYIWVVKFTDMRNLLIIITFVVTTSTFAQKPLSEVDFNALGKEIFLTHMEGKQTIGSFWIPTVYWAISLKIMPDITPEVLSIIQDEVKDYVIVGALEANFVMNDNQPGWQMQSEQTLRKNVSVEFNGKRYKPVDPKDLSEFQKMIKSKMEPAFAKTLGNFGDGLNLFFFKIQDSNGKTLIDPYSSSTFDVYFDKQRLTYTLPLPSLMEDKVCPTDNATFPSNYVYCPFHGTTLEEQETAGPPPQTIFEK